MEAPIYLDGVRVRQLIIEDDLPVRLRLGDPYDGPEITLRLIPPVPDPPSEPEPMEPPDALRRRGGEPSLDRVEDPVVLIADKLRVVARGARTLAPSCSLDRQCCSWTSPPPTSTQIPNGG